MREPLIHHRGEKGLLLDCVATLETGESDRANTIFSRAGELYIESLIWANTAADSLFGEKADAARAPTGAPASSHVSTRS